MRDAGYYSGYGNTSVRLFMNFYGGPLLKIRRCGLMDDKLVLGISTMTMLISAIYSRRAAW
jgi:hypothetical protein